jgi:hypothetical protein
MSSFASLFAADPVNPTVGHQRLLAAPICAAALVCVVGVPSIGCGGKDSTAGSNSNGTGVSCNGADQNCQSVPYGACVGVQQAAGYCIDMSHIGATPCSSPSDCPSPLPSGTYAGAMAGPTNALCIARDGTWLTASTADAGATPGGYCAAIQTANSAGAANCTPNPCGTNGYCSYIRTATGTTVVECFWPI